jgi:hypothetical protein
MSLTERCRDAARELELAHLRSRLSRTTTKKTADRFTD